MTGTGERATTDGQGGVEAAVGEDRRVDAPDEVAQLGEGRLGLVVGVGHERLGLLGVGVEALAGPAEVHGERDEPLLGAVVQVALDAAALGLGAVDGGAPGSPRAG